MAFRGINKVILIGYLGQNPDIRYMSNGNPVANISVATTVSWKDKQTNELKEKTEWHRVVLFGKLADIASSYLHKGSQVYIEGTLSTRKWKNQDGQDRYVTEIIVSVGGVMQMLNSRYIEDSRSVQTVDIPKKKSDAIVIENNDKIDDEPMINFSEEDIPF